MFTKRSLASKNVGTRLKAVSYLLSSRPPETTALLSGALVKAMRANARVGPCQTREKLEVTKLQEDIYREINALIEALGTVGDPAAVDVLAGALREEPRITVRMAAGRALAPLSVHAAVGPLLDALTLLEDRGAHLPIKGEIALTLARIGDRRAVAPLQDFRERLTEAYESRSKHLSENFFEDATPLARRDLEEDLCYIVNCSSVVSKALNMFK